MGFRYLASRVSAPILAVFASGLLAAAVPVSPAQSSQSPEPEGFSRSVSRGLYNPRAVYLNPGDNGTTDAITGRLTLQHLVGGGVREFNRYHRFHFCDRIRFRVSANRAGWLYVLHRSDGGPGVRVPAAS